jgi:methionine-rich copper-binding protein CopC
MTKTLPLALLLLAASEPAMAHAFLDTADPPVGGTVAAAPKAVTLSFTQGVEPSFSTIEVDDASGVRVDLNDPHLAPGQDAVLTVDLKPLAPGDYTVTWHVTSIDTHKTQGHFIFTITP